MNTESCIYVADKSFQRGYLIPSQNYFFLKKRSSLCIEKNDTYRLLRVPNVSMANNEYNVIALNEIWAVT